MKTTMEETHLNKHLSEHHMKVTKERNIILRSFLAASRHVTAEELHTLVKKKHPGVGLATVYRTLALFCACGLAEQRQFGDGHTRYELTYNVKHHDHMICTHCHRIIEFENEAIEALQNEMAVKHHFAIHNHKLEIYGHCWECTKKEGARG